MGIVFSVYFFWFDYFFNCRRLERNELFFILFIVVYGLFMLCFMWSKYGFGVELRIMDYGKLVEGVFVIMLIVMVIVVWMINDGMVMFVGLLMGGVYIWIKMIGKID